MAAATTVTPSVVSRVVTNWIVSAATAHRLPIVFRIVTGGVVLTTPAPAIAATIVAGSVPNAVVRFPPADLAAVIEARASDIH